jgi:hypothetical protein
MLAVPAARHEHFATDEHTDETTLRFASDSL